MNKSEKVKKEILSKYKSIREFSKSVGIANSTLVSALDKENGIEGMAVEKVLKICDKLNLDVKTFDPLQINYEASLANFHTPIEKYIVNNFGKLSEDGQILLKKHLISILEYESELKKMQIKESPTEIYQISVPTTTRSYAAGAGSIVYDGDDQVTDLNYPSDRVPKETDFASRVGGDSMEPTFFDGDIVFVEHAEILKIGEIGLFNINGENYIKECGKDGLVSHNKKHPIIKPTSQDTIVCIGKVLGKL